MHLIFTFAFHGYPACRRARGIEPIDVDREALHDTFPFSRQPPSPERRRNSVHHPVHGGYLHRGPRIVAFRQRRPELPVPVPAVRGVRLRVEGYDVVGLRVLVEAGVFDDGQPNRVLLRRRYPGDIRAAVAAVVPEGAPRVSA